MSFTYITSYKFTDLNQDRLPILQHELKSHAKKLALKGTILLSGEGINLMLAGLVDAVEQYQSFLALQPEWADLTYKTNVMNTIPFKRLIVRVKAEIISMNRPNIKPHKRTAKHLSPMEFKRWYDDGEEMVVLDTRNDYEMAFGSFARAIDLNINTFKQFPQAIKQLPDDMKQKPVVMFCTGGVRCEKASVAMMDAGFNTVYQLDGGILNYFAQCGGEHYQGDCFVFDDRAVIDPNLQTVKQSSCPHCQAVMTVSHRNVSNTCQQCHQTRYGQRLGS